MASSGTNLTDQEITTSLNAFNSDPLQVSKVKQRLQYVTELLSRADDIPIDKDYIVLVEKGRQPVCRALAGDTLSIGRGQQADLVIDDDNISRLHCLLQRHGAHWKISDLGSKNGVFVNGKKMAERSLCDGDLIRVGNTQMVFGMAIAPI